LLAALLAAGIAGQTVYAWRIARGQERRPV